MDSLELVSEEISPFFGSIDEIVTAISGQLLDFKPFENSQPISCSSIRSTTISNQKPYSSGKSFSNPDALESLVRRVIKYHYWNIDETVATESPQNQSTSNNSLPELPPAVGDLPSTINSVEIDERDNSERGRLQDAMEHVFGEPQSDPRQDWGLLGNILNTRPDIEKFKLPKEKPRRIFQENRNRNRDSAICIHDDDYEKDGADEGYEEYEADEAYQPYGADQADETYGSKGANGSAEAYKTDQAGQVPDVRPPLRRGERFTLEHLLSQKQGPLSQTSISQHSEQTLDDNEPATLDDDEPVASDETPKPRINYLLPNSPIIHGRRNTWPKQPYREQPRVDDVFLVKPAQVRLRGMRSRKYNFFRRNYMCQSPVNEADIILHEEGMFHLQREHAAHLTRALNEILQHGWHGIHPCKRCLPRALLEDERVHEPKNASAVLDKWFGSIEEALTATEWRG